MKCRCCRLSNQRSACLSGPKGLRVSLLALLQDEVAPKAAGELALSVQVDLASSSRIYLMFDEAPSAEVICMSIPVIFSGYVSRTVLVVCISLEHCNIMLL